MKSSGSGFHYVYALKDPRQKPAGPFYIGKGVGPRADQHLLRPDASAKSARIEEIRAARTEPIVEVLISELSEAAALRIEAELIAAFGTTATGGPLTNQVVPTGKKKVAQLNVVMPSGSLEKAQVGLSLIKSAVLDLVRANPKGLSNGDVTSALGLQSDYRGGSINYLAYSILGLLLRDGTVVRSGVGSSQRHVASGK